MKQKLSLITFALLLLCYTGCSSGGDDSQRSTRIAKTFWIDWVGAPKYQMFIESFDSAGLHEGGTILVGMMVYAAGSNNDFIIIKQHPDFVAADDMDVMGKPPVHVYRLHDAADSVYLPKQDKVFMDDSAWYHYGTGWETGEPDSVFKRITFYYILDIRKYKMGDEKSYTMYKSETLTGFIKKREELGVPANLDFTMVNKEME